MKPTSRPVLIRSLIFVAAATIILYLLPRGGGSRYIYELGKPWSYSLLTAPTDMPIYLDSISVKHTKDSIDASFQPVYKRLVTNEKESLSRIAQRINAINSPGLTPSQRNTVIDEVKKIIDNGIVDQVTFSKIKAGKLPNIRFIHDNVAISVPTSGYLSPRMAYTRLDSILPGPVYHAVLESIDIPDHLTAAIVLDTLATDRMRDELYQKAFAPVGLLQQGERIIDRGDIVTPQHFSLLHTYESIMKEKSSRTSSEYIYILVGQTLYVIILLASLYCYLYFFRPRIFRNNRAMIFIMTLITGFALLAFGMSTAFRVGLYLVPFVIIPIMMVVFFDSRTALFCLLTEIMTCAIIAPSSLEFIFLEFIAGLAAINSLKDLSRRSQLLRTAVFVFVAYSIGYFAIEMLLTGSPDKLQPRIFGSFGINAVFVSFAYIMIFVVEKIFGFTSKVTLVELSDVNNPILRELSEQCPGTFQHSMQVSNLAAEAAHRIGADVQLVRAGAMYHDIGKIENPAFFTENQHGVNPHLALSPEQSARVVISHVTDGLRRADKGKLPTVIRDFIAQHHGKGKARYFYNTYCNAHPDEEVDPAPYTYPGPNPQTRETSILMMADAVEAASRSLSQHTPAEIAALVDRIIDGQIEEGLLSESPLSFRDISAIKASFNERLRTMYHARVSYPEKISDRKPSSAK
ncbi:MAG: HDIG domain-containing protein [Pseudoflavonifractor sp.]|nr:HDIG domain-containing protein [Pseudoflavonifractor sp.]